MHQSTFDIKHFFIGHAKVHHNIYKGNLTYSVGDRDPEEVTFAWWAMPLLPISYLPVFIGLYFLFGIWASLGALSAALLYQTAYEYLHYCMHIAQGRWIERQFFFRWLNDRYLQHHRKHFTNLNVVLPIADYVFRTRRSCAEPDAVTIAKEVGILPVHRRPPGFRWIKKAKLETWWSISYVWKHVFKSADAEAN
ncbi:MAG: hypothetical protein EXR59_05730 [Dehalococcoidia bacterium]|nr:hypothetical protein [Dehalococcoidia bacterium]